MFGIRVAQAYLNAGDEAKTAAALDAYLKDGGAPDALYWYTRGASLALLGKLPEAYDAFLSAAAENYEDSAIKAKALYAKINGKEDGFEAALEAKLKSLPYHPEPFKPAADWKGKAVLIEIFTARSAPPASRPTSALTASSRLIPPNIWPSSNITCPSPDPIP